MWSTDFIPHGVKPVSCFVENTDPFVQTQMIFPHKFSSTFLWMKQSDSGGFFFFFFLKDGIPVKTRFIVRLSEGKNSRSFLVLNTVSMSWKCKRPQGSFPKISVAFAHCPPAGKRLLFRDCSPKSLYTYLHYASPPKLTETAKIKPITVCPVLDPEPARDTGLGQFQTASESLLGNFTCLHSGCLYLIQDLWMHCWCDYSRN